MHPAFVGLKTLAPNSMKTLSRGLSLVTLLVWGALLLYFYFSGRLSFYLIPTYRPLVAAAGFVMLAIAGTLAWGMRPGAAASAGLVLEDRGDEFSSPRRARTMQLLAFAMLVLPVWVAAAVSEDQFGVSAMRNRGIVSDAANLPGKAASTLPPAALAANNPPAPVTAGEPPLPGDAPAANNPPSSDGDPMQYFQKTPDGHFLLEVTELLFAADDDVMRAAMQGKTAEIIGQFMPAKDDASGKRFQLVRMFMVCCAADARPVAVAVEKPAQSAPRAETDKLAELTWTKVVGTIDFPLENGRRVVVLRADKATPTDPPREAMLY